MAWMHSYSRDFLVWVDEIGSNHRDHIRKYRYAVRGQYPVYHRLLERGPSTCAIAAISKDGIVAVHLHKGSVNGDVFLLILSEEALFPTCIHLMALQGDQL